MATYQVKLIVEGRNTKVEVEASCAGYAAKLAKEQYAGNDVRVLSTKRVG